MTGEHVAETPNKIIPSPAVRKAIYAVAVAVGALFVLYGLITQEQLDAWLQVVATLITALPLVLALANTPKKES